MARIDPVRRERKVWSGLGRLVRRDETAPASAPAGGGLPVMVQPLVDEINELSDALLNDPTGRHLDRYKTAIRRFLDTAVNHSLRVTSEATHGLTQKVFSTIARIDIVLADLADAVLGRQQNVLKIRTILDQIKGMLIDLYR